jgi:hypothetical protein
MGLAMAILFYSLRIHYYIFYDWN